MIAFGHLSQVRFTNFDIESWDFHTSILLISCKQTSFDQIQQQTCQANLYFHVLQKR